jgi:hypothetical protein
VGRLVASERCRPQNQAVITIAEHLERIPPPLRPIVQAARRAVKTAAPHAKEVAYQSKPPRSRSAMWKLVRFAVGDEYVVGIGTFSTYAAMFFTRGRELDDGGGLLEGSGKDARFIRLREPADAAQPALRRVLRKAFADATGSHAQAGRSSSKVRSQRPRSAAAR